MQAKVITNFGGNIDNAVIILAHSPAPVEHYIDRYLAALHNSDIELIIVINKIDDQSQDDKQHLQNIVDIYKNIGYKIFYISAKNNIEINQLVDTLANKTAIFLGQSGVGKSETLNTILGEKITATIEVSGSTKKGCHTTTCSTLYEINDTMNIIDSPGIREFGLRHISQEELFDGFLDFKKYRGMCHLETAHIKKDQKVVK